MVPFEYLAEVLSHNLDQPRESGHNVIFASIAIRALKGHPAAIWKRRRTRCWMN